MKIVEVVTPIIAYHGTTDDISQFRPLTHFGTEQAARDRMDYKKNANGKIYKVQLDIRNPFTIKDFPGIHYDRVYAFELRDKKKLSQEDMAAITTLEDPVQLRAALLAKVKELGYDGFVYKNRYEDKGNISYVILDPSQVKVLEVISVGEVNEAQLNELNVVRTLQFIKQAHGDQLYGDMPYWQHPRAVALTGRKIFGSKFTSDAVKTAFLHDVVEDTRIGLDELRQLEFSSKVIEAVALLTKDKTLTYTQNIEQIINSGNELAMMVKYADNFENYSGDKSSWDPARAASSQKKYLKSLNMLGDALGVSHHIEENFADGKKPGRKGLAKRMGVDCSKSETELRRIAKNSSGEKQRMAHWCANMKGGKK